MKVRVSRTVKALFGKRWKQELKNLLEAGCTASEGKAGEFLTVATMQIHFAISKKGATVWADPDFLPKLEECELQLEGEKR